MKFEVYFLWEYGGDKVIGKFEFMKLGNGMGKVGRICSCLVHV